MAATFAIGGIMIYAKTIVSPPVSINQKDVYTSEVNSIVKSLETSSSVFKEDSAFNIALDRVITFSHEGKLQPKDSDNNLDKIANTYVPKFLARCFEKFNQPIWYTNDHVYMMKQRAKLLKIEHNDKTTVLENSTIDSLTLVSNIIASYHQAQQFSKSTGFHGIVSARNTISNANRYMKDKYLSNCTSLVGALRQVSGNIGRSWYNFVSSQVEKLANYEYYSKDYYDNTLVMQVDNVVTEYDKSAAAIVGSKQNVEALWDRARSYYQQAMNYYGPTN